MTEQEMLLKLQELQAAAYNNAKAWVPTWAKVAIVVFVLIAIVGGAAGAYYHFKHENAVILTQEQLKQKEELANALNISTVQAARLAAELKTVKEKPAEIKYVVQAPTVQAAAVQEKKNIDAGKSPANKIPADKTIVTANEQRQTVEVFRITLDKAKLGFNTLALAGGNLPVEVGAGVSYTNKDWGIDAGYTSQNRVYALSRFYPKFLNK